MPVVIEGSAPSSGWRAEGAEVICVSSRRAPNLARFLLRQFQIDALASSVQLHDAEAANLAGTRRFAAGGCATLAAFPFGLQHGAERRNVHFRIGGLLRLFRRFASQPARARNDFPQF